MSCERKFVAAAIVGLACAVDANAQFVATGPASNSVLVQKFSEPGGQTVASFFAYAATFTGGVRIALGDVNGDGVPDIIVGPGSGGGPEVKAFDGVTGAVIRDYFAFATSFSGGVYVASGNIASAAHADIVAGAGPGGSPEVKVFDGVTGAVIRDFFAFAPSFSGGVRVAVGDVNGDGVGDIITGAGPGGAPEVKVFDGVTGAVIRDFFAYPASYTGGVFVAAGDINGDGAVEIITGTDTFAGMGPQVNVFNGQTLALMNSFFAFAQAFSGGVRVATGDVNGDGIADIIVAAGPGGGPQVSAFSGVNGAQLTSFDAYAPSFAGGVFVAGGKCSPGVCPPSDNECAAAIPVTLGTPQLGTSIDATPSTTLSNDGSNEFCTQPTWTQGPQKDVFFRFTPATTGVYTVDTCGSTFDTILGVHSGCPAAAANMIGCNDDSTSGAGNASCSGNALNSRIPIVSLIAGQTYYLRVFGYAGATGAIVVNVNAASPIGACCTGTHCTITTGPACTGSFQGVGVLCGPPGNPTTCCIANFDRINGLSVQDIFAFLNAWFAGDPAADINGGGLSVQDLFAFLNAWFAGCP